MTIRACIFILWLGNQPICSISGHRMKIQPHKFILCPTGWACKVRPLWEGIRPGTSTSHVRISPPNWRTPGSVSWPKKRVAVRQGPITGVGDRDGKIACWKSGTCKILCAPVWPICVVLFDKHSDFVNILPRLGEKRLNVIFVPVEQVIIISAVTHRLKTG